MPAFSHESLWAKSKVFMDHALHARDDDDEVQYHLWAVIALELLAKAALANIHPTLVADPQDIKSLLAACGRDLGVSLRSITAKTVFERMHTLGRFDKKMMDACMLMANRRNAELHSGETPMAGLDAD